jgi:beta-galactosidase
MDHAQFARLFPLGSHLCREPMPAMGELKRDMELLGRQGFNLIKLQEHWMIDEPAEGCCDFGRYEELIEHAARLDLGVYLGLTCEQAPHWLYAKHPDCRMVRRDGVVVAAEAQTTLSGSDGKPGPCFDHPGARHLQRLFLTRLVQTLGRFENLVVWNTWQEIGYWGEGLVGGHVCYCPHTLAAWRAWLRERHGDLDALNRAWNSRYHGWDDIQPDRGRVTPCPQELSWRYFMDNVQVTRVLQDRAAAIRAADPRTRPVFAHKGGPAYASGQDWAYARAQDFLGCSCYPAWGCGHPWDDGQRRPLDRGYALYTEAWDGVSHRYDQIRSANPGQGHAGGVPIWAAEFQGGPVSTGFHKGRVPTPQDIRRWMLTAVGAGVNAISFWVTRAEIMAPEQNGFSLLDSVGDTTPRLEEAGRIGRALNAHAELCAGPTLEPAAVGLLVAESNHQLCAALAQGGGHLAYSTRGWYRLLLEANIPLDFVSVDHDLAGAGRYRALILPFPLSLSAEVAAQLARYVDGGGHLVSEAAPGRIDAEGVCPRGEMAPALASLFGARQADFAMVREPDGGQRWSPPERTWGEYLEPAVLTGVGPLTGHQLRANVYLQTLSLAGGTACLRYGEAVAGVTRQVGRGGAWLLGTYVGHNGTAYRDPASQSCIRRVLEACGVSGDELGGLVRRRRVTAAQEAWILTNPRDATVTEQLDVTGFGRVTDLLTGGRLPVSQGKVRVCVAGLDVAAVVLEREGRTAVGSGGLRLEGPRGTGQGLGSAR